MLEKRKGPGQKPRAIVIKSTRCKDRYHVIEIKKTFERKRYFRY